eukprot:GHVT01021058.1.p1 GENE.GHVT01021058.1~~GHVT01021058.1.p1  ORF type:complete len:507 (+),score=154.95 GHVT01021058.1:165-1685(+)
MAGKKSVAPAATEASADVVASSLEAQKLGHAAVVPSSESSLEGGSSVPASPSSATSLKKPGDFVHPDFPGCKTLLVSTVRRRRFLERSARELLAGGTQYVALSALGEAMQLAIQLADSLEAKNAAIIKKVETTYHRFDNAASGGTGNRRNRQPRVAESVTPTPETKEEPEDEQEGGAVAELDGAAVAEEEGGTAAVAQQTTRNRASYAPGIRIYMQKHPDFKGSRISPGYVSFLQEPKDGQTFSPIYDEDPKDRVATVNAGDPSLYVGGAGLNKAFGSALKDADIDVEKFQKLHEALLKAALEESKDKQADTEIRSTNLENVEEIHPDVKFAQCRVCHELRGKDSSGSTGAAFISIFKSKFPHGMERNMGMVYVVPPSADLFKSKEDFIDAVEATAHNLLTALCDYNGTSKREGNRRGGLQRLHCCRISLFSGGRFKHPNAPKIEVAEAIIRGLEDGYRHGPAPRINFAYDENVFHDAWMNVIGVEPVVRAELNGEGDEGSGAPAA